MILLYCTMLMYTWYKYIQGYCEVPCTWTILSTVKYHFIALLKCELLSIFSKIPENSYTCTLYEEKIPQFIFELEEQLRIDIFDDWYSSRLDLIWEHV